MSRIESLTRTRLWRLSPSLLQSPTATTKKVTRARWKNKFDASVRACRIVTFKNVLAPGLGLSFFCFFVGKIPVTLPTRPILSIMSRPHFAKTMYTDPDVSGWRFGTIFVEWNGRVGGRRTTDTPLVQVYTNDMRSILAKRLYARTFIKLSHKHLGGMMKEICWSTNRGRFVICNDEEDGYRNSIHSEQI